MPVKTVAFIVARLNSSRFPAKQLRDIGDKPLLSWTLSSLKKSREIDEIVLTTTAEKTNIPLIELAHAQNIKCFAYKGDPNAVTSRLLEAAGVHAADICVLVSGDCPLTDGIAVDELIVELRSQTHLDYVITPPNRNGLSCMLQGVSVARYSAWKKAEELSITAELKEHHFPVLFQQNELFNFKEVFISQPIYSAFHRLSIDTYADFQFFNILLQQLKLRKREFTLENVVSLLDEEVDLKKINSHVYQRKVLENIPVILFIEPDIPTQPETPNEKVDFNMQLALYLTEAKGWPVTFITSDSTRKSKFEHYGIGHKFNFNLTNISSFLNEHTVSPHVIIDTSQNSVIEESLVATISGSASIIQLGSTTAHISSLNLSTFHYPHFYDFSTGGPATFAQIANAIQSTLQE